MKEKNSLLERLRGKNRTVLEMELGILAIFVLSQVVSVIFPGDRLARAVSLLIGSVAAALAVLHMYRTLDRALDLDEKNASKAIYQGYLVRYLAAAVILLGTALIQSLNPLLTFWGYMSLKLTAYLQPLTHKLCNKLFQETDPEVSEEVTEECT